MKSGISYRNWFKNSFFISYLLLFFICYLFYFYTYFIAIHILLKQPEQTKIERRVYFGIERFPKSIYRNPVSKENKEYKKENVFVFDCYIFAKHKLLQSETPNRDSN